MLRPTHLVGPALAALVFAAGVEQSGCYSPADDCTINPNLACYVNAASSASTGSNTGTGGNGGNGPTTSSGPGGNGGSSGSGGGTTMTNCDPTMGAVDGSCGVFVSSSMGHDSDGGTKAKPVKTLAHAIELAATNGSRVYACGEEFDEAITLPAGTSLYGALDCAHGWTYAAAAPTQVLAPADQIALTLAPGAATSTLSDVSITAADAMAAGGSSIAVFANAATATLERCTLTAGIGATGVAGMHQDDVVTPATADGGPGGAGCASAADVPGGAHGNNTCASPTTGGSGGPGTNGAGDPGGDGLPLGVGTPPKDGKGGPGGLSCTAGDGGADGPMGVPAWAPPRWGTSQPLATAPPRRPMALHPVRPAKAAVVVVARASAS
jgi:hypothetical protein